MNKTTSKQSGFTLVEMSIVLVIIGLIISGILVGQDLINNARVGATVTQIQKLDTAYNTFRGKYNGIPGDLDKAIAFLGTAAQGNGDGFVEDDDGAIAEFSGEVADVFYHLSLAGMVDGNYIESDTFSITAGTATSQITKLKKAGITLIANSDGDNHWVIGTDNGFGLGATGGGIAPSEAYGIDFKLDDGAPDTGNATVTDTAATVGGTAATTNTALCSTDAGLGSDYDLTFEGNNCVVFLRVSG
jgi:prepilin-type N-terminal cleavage/methylation domain-containing protein